MTKQFPAKYFWFCLLVVFRVAAFAQTNPTDSLEKAAAQMPDDTTRVQRLNDLVSKLEYADPARAAVTARTSIRVAEKLHYTLGLATAWRLLGVLYNDKTQLDSSKFFFDKALALVKDSKDRLYRRQLGLLIQNYGVIYSFTEAYDSAIAMYLQSAKIYKEINEESLLFYPYNNLAYVYTLLGDNIKSLKYAREAHAAALQLNNPNFLAFAINQEISAMMELKLYDSVLIPLQEQLVRAKALQNKYMIAKVHNMLGTYYTTAAKQYDSAIFHYKNALALMKEINNGYEIAAITNNTGHAYMVKGDYINASIWLKQALALGKTGGLDQVQKYALENLVKTEEKLGKTTEALVHYKDLLEIKDSVQARSNRKQVNELEAKYQAERKEFQIRNLENEKQIQSLSIRQKTVFNYILLGAAAIILLISLLSYRNYRQKQKLQHQRIAELETEKKLTATEAVLKGEEQERARLAKDLHDGLSGMLSGAKYSLQTMKGNLIMTEDNQQAFERGMDMLDSSIKEMRRVAQNMMPEALLRFGLDTALKDYCTEINKTGVVAMVYQSMGMEQDTVAQSAAIAIYRVVQELTNNIIKHAGASQALVQLLHEGNKLIINVEDNGKGFDNTLFEKSTGMGWQNIRSRVEYLKGKYDIQSTPDNGTAISIELNLAV